MLVVDTLGAIAHLHRPRVGRLSPPAQPLKHPRYTFDTAQEYARVYRSGTEFEMSLEKDVIENFNKASHVFRTWVVCRLKDADRKQHWLFALQPTGKLEGFPQPGDRCMISVNSQPSGRSPASRDWPAVRIDMPQGPLKDFAMFQVSMPVKVATELVLKPIVEMDCPLEGNIPHLCENNMTYTMISLDDYSDVTSKAELGALDALMEGTGEQNERVQSVFDWIRTFKDPSFSVNLFDEDKLPHMRHMLDNPATLPPKLRSRVETLNQLQKSAYTEMLTNLPCGVGIVPGGPGGGKTFFNMHLTAMAQASPIDYVDEDGNKKQRRAKILYLLDINSPVDDATNKCVKMSEELGDDKKIVRMFGWGREMDQGMKSRKKRHRSTFEAEDAAQPAKDQAGQEGMASNFLLMAQMAASDGSPSKAKTNCRAPTLDQLAFQRFEESKAGYPELDELLQEYFSDPCFDKMRQLRDETYALYKDTLDEVDFVASTPVAAVNLAGGRFKPDIVLFDEAPHARELANLIAIAHFEPMAWIFTGDFRQTGCFLRSNNKNPYEMQMKMSIMERAHHAGVIKHELLMNHRAYGRLHQMPSAIFYDNRMMTGISDEDMLPEPTKHLRRWLERFTNGARVYIPRLLVHQLDFSPPVEVAKSWYNPGHQAWVLERCRELMTDSQFRSVDGTTPGSILIIAPYREAFLRYKKAVQALRSQLREQIREAVSRELSRGKSADYGSMSSNSSDGGEASPEEVAEAVARIEQLEKSLPKIEARTIDTVQGHEADIVFIDLVRTRATGFLDDPKRLAVATTRARQAEVYLMPTSMAERVSRGTVHLARIFEACRSKTQGLRAWV